jgi:hypothetical protein
MPKKKTQKLNLIDWCDQQVAEGKELKIVWDGGNDSGWVHCELDGTDIENEYTETLTDYMNSNLDYGSWAGEFSASGDAVYDTNLRAFVGEDYYSEIHSVQHDINAPIVIPKHLWFNELHIHIETEDKYDVTVTCRFIISNGFLTEEHKELLSRIENHLEKQVQESIEKFDVDGTFDSIWDDVRITPADVAEKTELDNIFYVKEVEFRVNETEEKSIYLDLNEVSENIKINS